MSVGQQTLVEEAARRLQVWAFPLILAQRVRLNFTLPLDPEAPRPPTSAGAPMNQMGHQRELSTPELKVGVAPNVDTLYSVAWVDLDGGEYVLTSPDFGERYYTFQIGLADTRSPWAFGQRTHGAQVPPIHLVRGELAYREDDGRIVLSTPHRYVMICGRTLVEPTDPMDLAPVHRLQDQVRLERLGKAQRAMPPAIDDPEVTNEALARVERHDEEANAAAFAMSLARVLRDFAPSAIPPFVAEDLVACGLDRAVPEDPGMSAAVERGLGAGLSQIRDHVQVLGGVVNGWAINDRGPEFDDDHLLRAAVAYSQIFINPAEEALYPVCEVDYHGEPLDGWSGAYTLTFGAGDQPPALAFWSLTMYHRAGLLVANALCRYAIGNRTAELVPDEDGSLTVHIATSPPDSGSANWLPAPAGPFRLMLRVYCPSDRQWAPPPVARVS